MWPKNTVTVVYWLCIDEKVQLWTRKQVRSAKSEISEFQRENLQNYDFIGISHRPGANDLFEIISCGRVDSISMNNRDLMRWQMAEFTEATTKPQSLKLILFKQRSQVTYAY